MPWALGSGSKWQKASMWVPVWSFMRSIFVWKVTPRKASMSLHSSWLRYCQIMGLGWTG